MNCQEHLILSKTMNVPEERITAILKTVPRLEASDSEDSGLHTDSISTISRSAGAMEQSCSLDPPSARSSPTDSVDSDIVNLVASICCMEDAVVGHRRGVTPLQLPNDDIETSFEVDFDGVHNTIMEQGLEWDDDASVVSIVKSKKEKRRMRWFRFGRSNEARENRFGRSNEPRQSRSLEKRRGFGLRGSSLESPRRRNRRREPHGHSGTSTARISADQRSRKFVHNQEIVEQYGEASIMTIRMHRIPTRGIEV